MIKTQYLEQELQWFTEVLNTRLKLYFGQPCDYGSICDIPMPALQDGEPYCNFIATNKLSVADRLLLILSLVPLVKPHVLDYLMLKNSETDQRFTEFGGVKLTNHQGLLPNLEMLYFILAGDDLAQRMEYMFTFNAEHFLFRDKLLMLEPVLAGEPFQAAAISVSPELAELVLRGNSYSPDFSSSFPAKKITTTQEWKDLVLNDEIMEQIGEVQTWLEHGEALITDWGLGSKMKPGHRCLFYGPSGTGKTLTATLLGKHTGLDVYRVDLSMITSKYIGETEKNLSRIFDRAEHRNWILFFDEADALFGKRTEVKDAHDRFANQEVSFLLQRVEEYAGLVILATNFKSNIDDAFARRFQTVVHFPIPRAEQRELIWTRSFPEKMKLDPSVDMKLLSKRYEMPGGSIINVVRYCALMALKRNSDVILGDDIMAGIKREFIKEGKAMQ